MEDLKITQNTVKKGQIKPVFGQNLFNGWPILVNKLKCSGLNFLTFWLKTLPTPILSYMLFLISWEFGFFNFPILCGFHYCDFNLARSVLQIVPDLAITCQGHDLTSILFEKNICIRSKLDLDLKNWFYLVPIWREFRLKFRIQQSLSSNWALLDLEL